MIVGRLCEAFGMRPTVAVKELRKAPDLIARVLEERDYAFWFAKWKAAETDKDLPRTGEHALFDLVIDNETARLRERTR